VAFIPRNHSFGHLWSPVGMAPPDARDVKQAESAQRTILKCSFSAPPFL
jgi:hypothetical protein